MPPYSNIPLSPAELSYLRTSLIQDPPIRPDGRSFKEFRPLVAETDILPSANGSGRVCFADGTEAIVGIKAEVEATTDADLDGDKINIDRNDADMDIDEDNTGISKRSQGVAKGQAAWVDISVEIPGVRDDDSLPIFLAAMLSEALLADGGALTQRLYISRRFHWRLHIDILLLSQTLSYPLPLLSLTTHLALLSTRLPALVSEKDEDPLFNDDWEASTPLYPRQSSGRSSSKPSVTLLVMSVGENIIFDPSRDELAVADAVVAISCGYPDTSDKPSDDGSERLRLLAVRSIDPPSRLTSAGIPVVSNAGGGGNGAVPLSSADASMLRERDQGQTIWRPPRGGVRRGVLARMIKAVLEKDGVGKEVMDGLATVQM